MPQLSLALDELASAYHETPADDSDRPYGDPPRLDYGTLRENLGGRFPDLGYYACADPSEPVVDAASVGDALDDLIDIFKDLSEVAWRFDHVGADDACWSYRYLFQIHWGRHLRDLSLFLHAAQFG